jgi:hypothetical protein
MLQVPVEIARVAPEISVVSDSPLNAGFAVPQPFEGAVTMVYCPAASVPDVLT